MNELRFEDRVAVVTGAGGNPGLGRSYARLLAARGAKVVVNDVGATRGLPGASDNADAKTVVAEIVSSGGEAIADEHSVSEPEGARALVDTALEAFGRLDIVVNNAGVCIHAPVLDVTDEDIRLMLDVNLLGTIHVCRAALPHLRRAGYGRIVNTTSGAAFGYPLLTIYAASKAAVIGFTRALATETANDGDIRCNMISPGAGTRMSVVVLKEDSPVLAEMMRTAPPDLVAPVVAYLAHEDCPVNGEILSAAGGAASRVVLQQTAGLAEPDLTPEAVRDRFDEIIDMEGAQIAPMAAGEVAAATSFAAKPYRPIPAPR
jgi:NAD(P)-dependent dehydrogenase (short-subunit alcohol dehydrogenase family)